MLDKIKKLSIIFDENNSEKSLINELKTFFAENFEVKDFNISTDSTVLNLQDKKIFHYPIFKNRKIIGNLEFDCVSSELEDFLKLTSPFFSIKIQNIVLLEKMQKNIDFHDTMKNIAKIIETQYELNYIIPLIGEMLDKFFPDYLTYLFLKDEKTDSNILNWPLACRDTKILETIKFIETPMIIENKKVLAIPLKSEGKDVGVLVSKSTNNEITDKDIDYLSQLAVQIATTINRANVYAEILKHATLDALTGFYNRRQLEERIKQEVSNAKRQKSPLCGIMTDVDYFKNVNDTYGHTVGDLVLKTIAKIIRGQLREYDIAGRYGGEEFSIILPFTKIEEAKMVAERLRKSIESKVIDISKENNESNVKTIKVTISLGVYEMKLNDDDNDLLKKADKALYKAKNTGRNKVVVEYNDN